MKRRYRWPLWSFTGLVVLLVALHFALPYLVRDYLNDRLANMGAYRGEIADVDLALWRGAYKINGLKIVKVEGKVPVPFVNAPLIDLSVSWHSLWYDHAVVAEVKFVKPEVNFVDGGANKKNSQTGEGTDWRAQLGKLLPITLNEVKIDDGKITFRNFNSKPPVNLNATKVDLNIYNLTNVVDSKGKRDARFDGKALLLGHAPLETTATFDPLSNFEDFEFRMRARDIQLKRMNDFASAYGKFDFNAGHGDVVIEAQAKKSQIDGLYQAAAQGCRRVQLATGRGKQGQGDFSFHLGGARRRHRNRTEKPGQEPVCDPCRAKRKRPSKRYQRVPGVFADFTQWFHPGIQCSLRTTQAGRRLTLPPILSQDVTLHSETE